MYVFASLPVGGAEELLLGTVKHLNRTKFRPFVCSLTQKGPIGEEIEALGTEVLELGRMRRKGFDIGAIKDLRKVLQRKNIHIVHTHLYHGGLYGRLAANLAGIPCIVSTFHNTYARPRIRRHLINWALAKMTDRIFAVSEAVMEDLLRYDRVPPAKVVVLHNALELEKFVRAEKTAARRELGIADDVFLLGVIAKLEVQKGHRFLLEALHLLKPLDAKVQVLLVGRGTQENSLRRSAEELGLNDRVIFAGVRRDIPTVLSGLDLFILPSLWEGFGIVLLEALAMELPVVATDVGISRAIIIPGHTGLVVPAGDAGALASALRYAMGNHDAMNAMARIGRKHVEAQFSFKEHISKLEANYEQILATKS